MFRRDVLRSYLKGNFDDVAATGKIQAASCYLQSMNKNFELSMKDDLSEFFSSCELSRGTRRKINWPYRHHICSLDLVFVISKA